MLCSCHYTQKKTKHVLVCLNSPECNPHVIIAVNLQNFIATRQWLRPSFEKSLGFWIHSSDGGASVEVVLKNHRRNWWTLKSTCHICQQKQQQHVSMRTLRTRRFNRFSVLATHKMVRKNVTVNARKNTKYNGREHVRIDARENAGKEYQTARK